MLATWRGLIESAETAAASVLGRIFATARAARLKRSVALIDGTQRSLTLGSAAGLNARARAGREEAVALSSWLELQKNLDLAATQREDIKPSSKI